MWTTADVTLGGGTNAERLTVIASRGRERHWAAIDKPAVGRASGLRDDPLRDFLLEHQGQRPPPRRPVAAEPFEQQRGADVVGQVGDDVRAVADDGLSSICSASPSMIRSLSRERLLQLGERRDAAPVALDRDDRAPASSSARVRPPGPGPTS